MKAKILLGLALLFALGAISSTVSQTTPQVTPTPLSQREALALVRTVNTAEAESSLTGHPYVSLEQLLQHRFFQGGRAVPLLTDATSGTVKGYRVSVVASADGKHYVVTLVPGSGNCLPALFSDEAAVIYTAKALGCKEP